MVGLYYEVAMDNAQALKDGDTVRVFVNPSQQWQQKTEEQSEIAA